MAAPPRFASELPPFTLGRKDRYSQFIDSLLRDRLRFSPVVPGGERAGLSNPPLIVEVDIDPQVERNMCLALAQGALPGDAARALLADLGDPVTGFWTGIERPLLTSDDVVEVENARQRLGLCAVRVARAVHDALLAHQPFHEFRFRLTPRAKAALALGWEAIARLGRFPLPPYGMSRLRKLDSRPTGPFHFVSASDSDKGFFYTLGIALSPEAQALQTTDVSFGLDGELIVPGQAVSPIPPLLSLATRLFAGGIMTSSNISEEQHSIPIREFPQPDNYTDLEPIRPGLNPPEPARADLDTAVATVQRQLVRNRDRYAVDAIVDITGLDPDVAVTLVKRVLADERVKTALRDGRGLPREDRIGLFLNVQRSPGGERTDQVKAAVDTAAATGLRYLAIADDVEDAWLPGIHEYLEHDALNEVARYADCRGVLVIDGRPVDPVYTASTALQRIQSVMTTLSVDILKLGMWLTLESVTAEKIWRQIQATPAIAWRMCLMPIGIVEPWSAFVDDREQCRRLPKQRNPKAIIDPFEKIKFMIEEAERLGMPSLLTDTRHKHHWVLLGGKGGDFPKHPREMGATTSLLSWAQFLDCERRARKAGILLGQAGSIEVSQIFQIFSEITYDAAKERRNPATAIWTAETERVLRSTLLNTESRGLHEERSADVSPYLAVVNRAYESHAKLDGWLRFLAERHGKESPAGKAAAKDRNNLQRRRSAAMHDQDEVLRALAAVKNSVKPHGSALASAWDAFRESFTSYHARVRDLFGPTRAAVEAAWEDDHADARRTQGSK